MYVDKSNVARGYVRAPDGIFTKFQRIYQQLPAGFQLPRVEPHSEVHVHSFTVRTITIWKST